MEAFISNKSTTCTQDLREALLHVLPVDHIPDSLEVFGLAVLVLQATYGLAETAILGNSRLTSRRAPKHQYRGGA